MIDTPDIDTLRQRGSLKWTGIVNPTTNAPARGAWVAEMDFGTPPHVATSTTQLIDNGTLGYMPPTLPTRALDAMRDFYQQRCGFSCDAHSCGLLPDVLTALHLMLDNLVDPGAPVIVPTPAYMPFLTIPGKHDHPVVQVPSLCDEDGVWRLDIEALDQATTPGAVIIVCNPWNPVGRILDATELQAVADIANRHQAWIFNDEIHFPLTYPDQRFTPLVVAAPDAASRTVTATAASKGWNVAGLKCAQWIVTDPDLRAHWSTIVAPASHQATPIGTLAAATAFRDDRAWLDDVRAYVAHNAHVVRQVVADIAPDIVISRSQATYLSWWDCGAYDLGGRTPATVALEDADVAVNAGSALGDNYTQCLRFNIATPTQVMVDMATDVARAIVAAAR